MTMLYSDQYLDVSASLFENSDHPSSLFLCFCCRSPFRVVSYDLNFDLHAIRPQSRNPHTSPKRLMVRHPFFEVPDHCRLCLIGEVNVV